MSRVNRLVILQKRKAEFIEPMNCAPVPHLPDGPQWLFDIKLDGYRPVAVAASTYIPGGTNPSIINTRTLSKPLASYRKARLLTVKWSLSMNQADQELRL